MRQPIDNIGWEPLTYNPQTSIYISQKFGENKIDYSQFGLIGHNGIDYAAPTGTPYYAVTDGWIIEQTKKETGYGYRLCILDKLNRVWVYGHSQDFAQVLELDWNFWERKYPVKEGHLLGFIDSTGFSTGPHLHLGVYQYDNKGNKLNGGNGYGGAIDPWPILTGKDQMDNEFVKTINIKGTVGLVVLADDVKNLIFLGKVHGKEITVNPDGSIPTDYKID